MDFTYDELKMIKTALLREVVRREERHLNTPANMKKLQQFEDLYDKVCTLIQNVKSN